MKRTRIQFSDPLYQRLNEIARLNDWALTEVVRRAAELYVQRFPQAEHRAEPWDFPVLDLGDFLLDPAEVRAEADAVGS